MALDPRPVVITTGTNPNPSLAPEPLIAVGGLPTKTQVAALTAITTANASDAATTQALVNEIKAKVNAIIAALKA